tara:strand:- start:1976 stop:3214 length:1239 start_codon:yes stop_codon:yes gene_type:complete
MSHIILYNAHQENQDASFMLSGSKSISHRLLIINYLSKLDTKFENISESEDTMLLKEALYTQNDLIYVKQSGTVLRFLISLFAYENRNVTITGKKSLFRRPLKYLIESLEKLGANIKQHNNKIIIEYCNLRSGSISFQKMYTSQFVSSILLISPYLPSGITLKLPPELLSLPYIKMTVKIMANCGSNLTWKENVIKVLNKGYSDVVKTVESDWTSASYLFLSFAFSNLKKIRISSLYKDSLQPDKIIVDFFALLGIQTQFYSDHIFLNKIIELNIPQKIVWDFNQNPDVFPTIVVACLGFNIDLCATGIESLKYKESNRVQSMISEAKKFNCFFEIKRDNQLLVRPCKKSIMKKKQLIIINSHDDHRVALAFSTLVLLDWKLQIDNPSVINKSYPNYWSDLIKFGVRIENFE